MRSAPKSTVLSRRELGLVSSATALLAPFLGRSLVASAAGAPPKNLVLVTWPEGLETGWHPKLEGGTLKWPSMTKSLAPHTAQLCAIRGLRSGYFPLEALTAHTSGPMSLWTGCKSKGGPEGLKELPTLASIDQLFAARFGGETRFRSLHFGAATNQDSFICTPFVHFSGSKKPIPAEDDPLVMYSQIFATSGQSAAQIENLRKRKASVIDFVRTQLKDSKAKLPKADQLKMDEHLAGIRALEKSLDGLGTSCAAPAAKPGVSKEAAMADANFPSVIGLQTDLLVASLQCGLTRVATLQISNTDSKTKIPGIATTRGIHEAQHSGTYDDRAVVGAFFMERLAYVIDRLKKVDVGNGRTLLDDTLVVAGSDMAIGTHASDPAAFFVAGGGGVVKLGQLIDVANKPVQHTQLLNGVVKALGMGDVGDLGDFKNEDAKGVLPGLLG
jgi:Protein of unknown function (DUF1552)